MVFISVSLQFVLIKDVCSYVQVCLNRNECRIELGEEGFNKGLCPTASKKLAVEAMCSQ